METKNAYESVRADALLEIKIAVVCWIALASLIWGKVNFTGKLQDVFVFLCVIPGAAVLFGAVSNSWNAFWNFKKAKRILWGYDVDLKSEVLSVEAAKGFIVGLAWFTACVLVASAAWRYRMFSGGLVIGSIPGIFCYVSFQHALADHRKSGEEAEKERQEEERRSRESAA